MSFQMYVPTRILFGEGQLSSLHEQKLPGTKAMIVISNGKSTKENGALDKTQQELKMAGVETVLFDKIMANPLKSTVMEGAAFARENGCDFIIALGGGSVMDASKAIAAMATNGGDLWDYIGAYLARAVKDGSDMEAREHVAFANTLSGVVMTLSGCTSEHSMEHAMSAYHHELPHGAGLIMISKEYFTHFVKNHACDERFVRMAHALGMKETKEPMDFITALVKLQEECGVADLKMSDYGIMPEEFMTLAKNARATMGGLYFCDRVPMSDEECAAIFEKAYR